MSQNNRFQSPSLPVIFALVSALSVIVGMRLQESLVKDKYLSTAPDQEMSAIYEAAEHINAKYYGIVNDSDFTDEVITQMVTQLDPYSHYFEAQTTGAYGRFMNGVFNGVGIEIKSLEGQHFIFRVIPDSPAEKAGLKIGDRVVQVADIEVDTSYVSIDSLMHKYTANIGDSVALEIIQLDGQDMSISLEVAEVEQPLIEDLIIETSPEERTSYVKIHRFYKNVFRDFMETLEEHQKSYGDVTHLIIDVRGNPGGVVEETVKILNQLFEEKNLLLLSTQYRSGPAKEYKSNGRGFISIDRLVILCDDNSASASEILAGVIQDYDRGVVIGENTFGKGVIQQNYVLHNNASLHLTVGEYILPTGRHIHSVNRKDTVVTSLINDRQLASLNGIPVDVSIADCKLTRAQMDQLNTRIIQEGLWDETTTLKFLNESPVEDSQDDCALATTEYTSWYLLKKTLSNGDIAGRYLDPVIAEAQEILWSNQYDQILGQK